MTHSSSGTEPSIIISAMSASAPPSRQPPYTSVFAPFDSPEHEHADELHLDGPLEHNEGSWLAKPARNRSQTTTPIAMHSLAAPLGEDVLTATQSSPVRQRHVDLLTGPDSGLDLDKAKRRLIEHQDQQRNGKRISASSSQSSNSSGKGLGLGSDDGIDGQHPSIRIHFDLDNDGDKQGIYRHPFARPSADGFQYPSSPSGGSYDSSNSSHSGSPPPRRHMNATTARKRALTDRAKPPGIIGGHYERNSSPGNKSSSRPSSSHKQHHQSSKSMSYVGRLSFDSSTMSSAQDSSSLFGSTGPFSSPNLPSIGQHPSFHLGYPLQFGQENVSDSELGSSSLEPDTRETTADSFVNAQQQRHVDTGDRFNLVDGGCGDGRPFGSDPAIAFSSASSSTLLSEHSSPLSEHLPKPQGSGDSSMDGKAQKAQSYFQQASRLGNKPRPPPLMLNPQATSGGQLTGTTQANSPFDPISPFGAHGLPQPRHGLPGGAANWLGAPFDPLAAAAASLQQHGWPQIPLGQSAEQFDPRVGRSHAPPSAGLSSSAFLDSAGSRTGHFSSGLPTPGSHMQVFNQPPLSRMAHHHASADMTNAPMASMYALGSGQFLGARAGVPMSTPVTPFGPGPSSGWPFGMGYGNEAGGGKDGSGQDGGHPMPGSAAEATRMQNFAAQLHARDSAVDMLQKHIDRLHAQLATLSVASNEGTLGSAVSNANAGPPEGASASLGAINSASMMSSGGMTTSRGAESQMSGIGLSATAAPFQITPSTSSGSMMTASSSFSSGMAASASDSETESNAPRNPTDLYIGPKVLVERALGPRNQEATIVLQQQLKTACPERKQSIVNAIAPHALQLAFDKHGNFLLQRAIASCPSLAWHMKGSFVQLSLSPYGCHVVQKILDEGEEYRMAVVQEMLDNRLAETLTSRNSIHVWQKLLEIKWSSYEFRKSIFRKINDTMRGHWARTAVQETGSIICQNIFESADAEDRQECILEILANLKQCAMEQYGVWVAQHLVEHGDRDHRRAAMDKLLEDAVTLTLSQYGQKAIMSALRTNDEIFVRRFVDILCGQDGTGGSSSRRSVLVEIGSTPQGLQIVTQLLTSVAPAQREQIIQTVRRNSVFLKGSKTGLKVHQLCERARAFTGY
ncbi:unnamed protein product [Tilletia controversa]|nr:hypothetical protein A4X03_0g1076 [Tilletia caries]CAD6973970.1 unnamed protein product [Tilletia controversa]